MLRAVLEHFPANGNLGVIFDQRGVLDRAEEMYKHQLDIAIELGIEGQQAIATSNLGSLYEKKGDMARACSHWGKGRDLFREIGVTAQVKRSEGWMRKAKCANL